MMPSIIVRLAIICMTIFAYVIHTHITHNTQLLTVSTHTSHTIHMHASQPIYTCAHAHTRASTHTHTYTHKQAHSTTSFNTTHNTITSLTPNCSYSHMITCNRHIVKTAIRSGVQGVLSFLSKILSELD